MASSHFVRPTELSLEEIRKYSEIDSELEKFLADQPAPSLVDSTDLAATRSFSEQSTKANIAQLGPPPPGLEQYELPIPVRDGWTSRCIVCRPALSSSTKPKPLIVMYHGGGFMVGSPEGMLNNARRLSRALGAVVLCPSYRLAPEHPFPTGINDAWDVLQWASKNAGELGADLHTGFIIGGNSAGANFAAVLTRRAVEEGLEPRVTGHWLHFPALSRDPEDGDIELVPEAEKFRNVWNTSWVQNKDAMLVNRAAARALFGHYAPDFASPLYNPLSARSSFDIAKLPKAVVQVAGMDLFRDDGIVYASALETAGVDVKLAVYKGVPHTFSYFLKTLDISSKAQVDVVVGFAWLLDMDIADEVARKAMLDD